MTHSVTKVAADTLPEHELQRLAALQRYEILDSPPDGAFDKRWLRDSSACLSAS